MEGKKISILGCGWLGLPLAKRLINEGFVVQGASRNENKIELLKNHGIKSFFINLMPSLSGHQIDQFFDCSLLIITIPPGRRRKDVEHFYPVAITNVVEAALKNNCTKIIYTSSTGVYGKSKGIVNENSELRPETSSSRAVVTVEKILTRSEQTQTTLFRLAGLVGPNRHPGNWLAGRKNLPNGDAPINLVHQFDVIEAILQSIKLNAWNKVFNVCANQHPTKSNYYQWAAKQLSLDTPRFFSGGKENKIVDSSVIRQQLGFKFKYDDPYQFFVLD